MNFNDPTFMLSARIQAMQNFAGNDKPAGFGKEGGAGGKALDNVRNIEGDSEAVQDAEIRAQAIQQERDYDAATERNK